jgi:hypothetical protein
MLINGQAVLVHGEPRLTRDIDITLGVVQETFVLPTEDRASGVRVDFIFSTTPYEAQAIGRAQRLSIAGYAVPFATPEDLVLHKLFAGRPRDLEDVRGVVRRKGAQIDWAYLTQCARELATTPGREHLLAQAEQLRDGRDL